MDNRNYSALKSLISLGVAQVNLNNQDNFLMTPLHIGAINYDRDCFNLLVSLKPNLLLVDNEGKTFWDYIDENEEISPSEKLEIKDITNSICYK